MDASQGMRKLLANTDSLNGDQIGGFVVGFIALGFFVLIMGLFTCTLSGKINRMEDRIETIESNYLGEEREAAKLN